MGSYVVVCDLETIPDLDAFAELNDKGGCSQEELEKEIGYKFQPVYLHQIFCIGRLIARWNQDYWRVLSLEAPSTAEVSSEAKLIQSFTDKVEELRPTLVTYNGLRFDLPVLRYRAMVNSVAGLNAAYFKRYGEAGVDLCDVLSNF